MSGGYLRRYTQLPFLIYMLTEKKLTLLDPQSWEDRNDSYYLDVYRRKSRQRTVLALCFTMDSETYHHWNVYGRGSAGICIEFKRNELVNEVKAYAGIRAEPVKYLKLTERRRMQPRVDDLPFVKRYAFRHETEFRLIYESASKVFDTLDLPIALENIARITLSPWLPIILLRHVRETLRKIPECGKLDIVRSTLISNKEWKTLGDEAIGSSSHS